MLFVTEAFLNDIQSGLAGLYLAKLQAEGTDGKISVKVLAAQTVEVLEELGVRTAHAYAILAKAKRLTEGGEGDMQGCMHAFVSA